MAPSSHKQVSTATRAFRGLSIVVILALLLASTGAAPAVHRFTAAENEAAYHNGIPSDDQQIVAQMAAAQDKKSVKDKSNHLLASTKKDEDDEERKDILLSIASDIIAEATSTSPSSTSSSNKRSVQPTPLPEKRSEESDRVWEQQSSWFLSVSSQMDTISRSVAANTKRSLPTGSAQYLRRRDSDAQDTTDVGPDAALLSTAAAPEATASSGDSGEDDDEAGSAAQNAADEAGSSGSSSLPTVTPVVEPTGVPEAASIAAMNATASTTATMGAQTKTPTPLNQTEHGGKHFGRPDTRNITATPSPSRTTPLYTSVPTAFTLGSAASDEPQATPSVAESAAAEALVPEGYVAVTVLVPEAALGIASSASDMAYPERDQPTPNEEELERRSDAFPDVSESSDDQPSKTSSDSSSSSSSNSRQLAASSTTDDVNTPPLLNPSVLGGSASTPSADDCDGSVSPARRALDEVEDLIF